MGITEGFTVGGFLAHPRQVKGHCQTTWWLCKHRTFYCGFYFTESFTEGFTEGGCLGNGGSPRKLTLKMQFLNFKRTRQ